MQEPGASSYLSGEINRNTVSKAYIDTFFMGEYKYMHQKSKYDALTSDGLSYVHMMDKSC